jgi:hypothetical protein
MATKQELIDEANEFAKELGEEVKTEGLNHSELTTLVAELEKRFEAKLAKDGAEDASPSAPAATSDPATAEPSAKPPRPPIDGAGSGAAGGPPPKRPPKPTVSKAQFVVARGKSLTCRRGVIDAGEEIRPADVEGGQKQIEYLVSAGLVVRGK